MNIPSVNGSSRNSIQLRDKLFAQQMHQASMALSVHLPHVTLQLRFASPKTLMQNSYILKTFNPTTHFERLKLHTEHDVYVSVCVSINPYSLDRNQLTI